MTTTGHITDSMIPTKSARYWHITGLVVQFIYDHADMKYHGTEDVLEYSLCEDLVRRTGSQANPHKVMNRVANILRDAAFAYDLPEHPDRHNGYYKSHQYEEKIKSAIGFAYKTQKK